MGLRASRIRRFPSPPQLLPSGVCAFVLMAERVFFFHLSPIYLHGSLQRAINSER